jgi:hypothetical protein
VNASSRFASRRVDPVVAWEMQPGCAMIDSKTLVALALLAACTSPPHTSVAVPTPVHHPTPPPPAPPKPVVVRVAAEPYWHRGIDHPIFRSELIAVDRARRTAIVHHFDMTLTTVDLDRGTVIEKWKPAIGREATWSAWYPRMEDRPVPIPVFDPVKRDRELSELLDGYRARLSATDIEPRTGTQLQLDFTANGTYALNIGDLIHVKRPRHAASMVYVDPAYDPALSPDGLRVAFQGCDPRCPELSTFIASTTSARERKVPRLRGPARAIWSPDGNRLYLTLVPDSEDDRAETPCLFVVDPDRPKPRKIACRIKGAPMRVAVSANRKTAAFPVGGELRWIDLDTEAELGRVVLPEAGFDFRVRLTDRGRFAAFVGDAIVLADLATGATATVPTDCNDGRWLSEHELVLACDGNGIEYPLPSKPGLAQVVTSQPVIALRVLDVSAHLARP